MEINRAMPLQLPHSLRTKSGYSHKSSARPHFAPGYVYGIRVYDFFFQICHKSSLNEIVEATAPVNPYGIAR